MTEEELIIANMLIHGHNPDVELLDLDEKLVDLAVMLATNEDYEKNEFEPTFIRPKLVLKESKVFLREKFILHRIPYADEKIIKMKLHGRIIRSEQELLKLYNGVGTLVDPLELPVKFIDEPYFYGNVSLMSNLSDDAEFLKNMKIFFKSIELSNRTSEVSGVCYVHEVVHTQLESLKGIVRDYYNSEVLSIFMELLYAYEQGPKLFKESLKIRINLFLTEFHSLYNYLCNGESVAEEGLWHNVVACKYIVSTVKAFHMINNYYLGDEIERNNMLWMIQKVFSGASSLEHMLKELGITYENSLDKSHVLSLIGVNKK